MGVGVKSFLFYVYNTKELDSKYESGGCKLFWEGDKNINQVLSCVGIWLE